MILGKQNKLEMKKSHPINDAFPIEKSQTPSPVKKKNQIVNIVEGFTTFSQQKKIRIVQMGPVRQNGILKNLSLTQSLKKANNMINASEIKAQQIKGRQTVDPNLFVEAVRAGEVRPAKQKVDRINQKSNSANGVRRSSWSSYHSQKKDKSAYVYSKNCEKLPRFSSSSNKLRNTLNDQEANQEEGICRSLNLLTKLADSNLFKQESSEETSILHFKRKYIDPFKKNPQEILEEQRRAKLQLKRQLQQNYAKPFNPPSNISAASYIIYEPCFSKSQKKPLKFLNLYDKEDRPKSPEKKYPHSHKILAELNSRTSVEIASLTKIMTCIVGLEICHRFSLQPETQRIRIGKFESSINGTSARIVDGEIYTLHDLFHGLMLPSGNDASLAIAVWGGKVLLGKEQGMVGAINRKKKDFYLRFICEMNETAKRIGMMKTNYDNTHGLANCNNRSCAYDLAILCEYAMQVQSFKLIVSCREYETEIVCSSEGTMSPLPRRSLKSKLSLENFQNGEEEEGEGEENQLDSNEETEAETEQKEKFSSFRKTVRWQNTHNLLQQKPEEYIGIKTGITNTAGPCLASCIQSQSQARSLIIIVLNCEKMSMRFRDTENLKKWAYARDEVSSPRRKVEASRKKISKKVESPVEDVD